jgi:membrane protein
VIDPIRRSVARVDEFQRSHAWLGFPVAVVKKFGEDRATNLAAIIAYYGFFSVFPLMLVMVTTLGYVLSGNEELQERIVDSMLTQFPVIGDQIATNVGSLEGSGVALAVGIVGALWAGLRVLRGMETAMDAIWDIPLEARRGFLISRVRSGMLLLVFGAALLGVVVLGAASTFGGGLGFVLALVSAAGSFALATAVFVVAFTVLTNRELAWRSLLPGALVAAAGFLTLQLIGGYYVGHVIRGATDTYGFFAVVIGLLSWMFLQALIAIFAAEVNVVRVKQLWPRSLTRQVVTEADERALRRFARMEAARNTE